MDKKYVESEFDKNVRIEREKRQNRDENVQNPFHFADRLNEQIKEKESVVCVGLDPRLDRIPEFIVDKYFNRYDNGLRAAAEAILEFNKGIIDAVADLVPVVKPQIAFYEQYGHEGIRAFEETLWYARDKGLLTIADIKRGDIGSTATAYAKAFLGKIDLFGKDVFSFDADSVTVAPYLGWDGIKPFLDVAKKHGKGVFVLVKTSNPSSGDLQDLKMADYDASIYEIMGHYLESWGANDIGESGYNFVGAVVGATYPEQMIKLRSIMPNTIFLVPGYGAQGGDADSVISAFDENGLGAVVNSSRGIIFAWENSDSFGEKAYAEASRAAVEVMNRDIFGALDGR